MLEASMTSKGQITIPADIRRQMGLGTGERVVFTTLDDGTTVMRAKTRSIQDLRGLLKPERRSRKAVSVEDMDIGQS
ncbi:AbrB/MazE/SpoVT family DNA-binding domain-containing protein [Pseudacidovorax intermedius]|uniref:AbrB family transcriptional regulator n=1 Tax=Pseudacidovorax intermedius TaxID=433924 RepID=A0A147GMQ7_9BURK|nr:type II toxin-antitoxin system PrlF family antitoxin [Pseudacidovorax intermedius]KTT15049.1 AbrB family transcriptional regulator [Pseudacidovorax intermedius]